MSVFRAIRYVVVGWGVRGRSLFLGRWRMQLFGIPIEYVECLGTMSYQGLAGDAVTEVIL